MLLENDLTLNVWARDGSFISKSVRVKKLCLARSCGRDIAAVRAALDAKLVEGYAVHGNPSVCRKSRYLLTQEDVIEVQGPQTSGEVEYVAIIANSEILISVGSDHNDRSLVTMWTEAFGKVYDSAKTKQMVPAVVAKDAWRYDDIKDHWDKLNLKSYITMHGKRIPYQDFTLEKLLDLEYYLSQAGVNEEDGLVLFGGSYATLPSIPPYVYQFQPQIRGLTFPSDFHFEIYDPILKRTISHSYTVQCVEEPWSMSL